VLQIKTLHKVPVLITTEA